jgi:serine/threonine-protein phosphatase 4 regulatory subunit 1
MEAEQAEEAMTAEQAEAMAAEQREQAAMGRLSSMSLIAAVTASGPLEEDVQATFVQEVERIGRDSVYWVRREASFAVGALAKVVPAEVVQMSLVCVFLSFLLMRRGVLTLFL